MKRIFSEHPQHKKRARLWATLWTLLIFILCFIPVRRIPDVNIPLADKWVHFVLFGVYAFLWLVSIRKLRSIHLLAVFISSVILGWLVEFIQGKLTFLGRGQDNMDTLADSIGGFLGVLLFYILYKLNERQSAKV